MHFLFIYLFIVCHLFLFFPPKTRNTACRHHKAASAIKQREAQNAIFVFLEKKQLFIKGKTSFSNELH